ncbi:MAG: hypothetical protein J2P25_03350 [Nocardiopsaceae bacterium]|nr:hypothetical protein [Nocardiopsaceae bacterium]
MSVIADAYVADGADGLPFDVRATSTRCSRAVSGFARQNPLTPSTIGFHAREPDEP